MVKAAFLACEYLEGFVVRADRIETFLPQRHRICSSPAPSPMAMTRIIIRYR
jgi:hypothetical protein